MNDRYQDKNHTYANYTSSGIGRPRAVTSNDPPRALPYAMSLRLLDSKDGAIASELAPFAQSYDVRKIHNA